MKTIALVCATLCAALRLGAADSQSWVASPEASRIDFAVQVTVDSFVGHLDKFETHLVGSGGAVTEGSVTFQVAALKTGKDDRDAQMLVWLEASKYPVATFVLKNLVSTGSQFQATGDLTLHGVTRSIAFPITFGRTGTRLTMDGTVTIDHREWGLKIIRKMAVMKVDPMVKVTFHLEATSR